VDGVTEQDEQGAGVVASTRTQADLSSRPGSRADGGLLDELLDLDGRKLVSIAPIEPVSAPSTRVGWLVAWAPGQAPTVEFSGNHRGPLAARSIIPLHPKQAAEAIADRRGVLLTFEDGRPDAPIITGLLQPLIHLGEPEPKPEDPSIPLPEPEPLPEPTPEPTPEPDPIAPPVPAPEFEPHIQPEFEPPDPRPEFEPHTVPEFEPPDLERGEVELDAGTAELDARVDGRRIEIEAADEIVLRCGEASIVLRRNGRVVIRGTYIETRSRGVNRVKGGSVEIN
jgi:hypothetical protein